jgi:hypothetical protein
MARLQQHHFETRGDKPGMQPLRQRAGLKSNATHRKLQLAEITDQRLRFAGNLDLANDLPTGVHNTHAAFFQRDVDSSTMITAVPLMMLRAGRSDSVSTSSF